MSRRLIYVVGPSGAGKDSVLIWLRQRLSNGVPMHWARRTIDRPVSQDLDTEQHESVDGLTFKRMVDAGEFAMHWHANRHRYGIRHSEMAFLLDTNGSVVVNGSREHLHIAANGYPGLTVLHITADSDVLRERLKRRGRESADAIEERLQRNVTLYPPPGCGWIEIQNNASLDHAGLELILQLQALGLWPGPQT
jgi:ribose 1,5-bisphosphokinase